MSPHGGGPNAARGTRGGLTA